MSLCREPHPEFVNVVCLLPDENHLDHLGIHDGAQVYWPNESGTRPATVPAEVKQIGGLGRLAAKTDPEERSTPIDVILDQARKHKRLPPIDDPTDPIDRPGMKRRVYDHTLSRGASGATCDECIVAIDPERHQSVSPAHTYLKQGGWLVPNGRRRLTRTGKTAKVYVAIPGG